jgi:hypothetical protein
MRDHRDSWDEEGGHFHEHHNPDEEGEVDLSAFESVVRKCGRILRGCEVRVTQSLSSDYVTFLPWWPQVESRFLSLPESSWKMHSIIEQVFEDLNSYSETSIQIDNVNNLELKLFPFFRMWTRYSESDCPGLPPHLCQALQQIRL